MTDKPKRQVAKLLSSLLFVAACGGSDEALGPDPGGSPPSPVGIYDLQTWNGDPLPAVQVTLGGQPEVLSSVLKLRSDGTFAFEGRFRSTLRGQVTTGDANQSGRWLLSGERTFSGSTVLIDWDDWSCGDEQLSLSDGRLSGSSDCIGAGVVYRKR